MGRSNFSTNQLLSALTKRAYSRYQAQTVDYQHLEAATTTTGFGSNRREYSSAALLAEKYSLNRQNLVESNYDQFLKSVGKTDWVDLLTDLIGENAGDDLGRQFSVSGDGTKLAVLAGTEISVYEFDATSVDTSTLSLAVASTYAYPSGGADVITGIAESVNHVVAMLTRTVGGTTFASLQRFDSTLTTAGVYYPDVWSGTQAPSVFCSSDGKRVALSFPDQGFRIHDYDSDGQLSPGYYVIDGTETVTFTVTVKSVGGNRYHVDGVDRPTLTFKRGSVYVFDMSDESNFGHPLAFSQAFDGASSSYTQGVVDNYETNPPGTPGSSVTFTVPSDAPSQLYYYCTVHGQNMGSSAASTVTSPLHGGAMSRNGLRVVTMDGTYDVPAAAPTQPTSLQRLAAVPRVNVQKVLCLTSDGNVMVAKMTDSLHVLVWTGVYWKQTVSFPTNEVADITVDAKYVVTAGNSNITFFRFNDDGSYEQYGQTLTHGAQSVSLNQNGDRAIIGEQSTGSSHVYVFENGRWLRNAALNINPGCARVSNDGQKFVTASDYTIRISQGSTQVSQISSGWKRRGDTFPIAAESLSLSDDGAYLIAGFTDPLTLDIDGAATTTFRVYSFADDQWSQHGPDMTYPGLRDSVVEMSPDGTRFAVLGAANDTVRVFNNAFAAEGRVKNILETVPVTLQKSTFGVSGDGSRLIVNDSVYENLVETTGGNFGDTVHLSKSGDSLAVGDNETVSMFSLNSQGVVSQVGGRILPTDSETFSGLILRQSTAGASATVDVNAAAGGVLNLSTTLAGTTEITSLTYDSSAMTVTSTREIAVDDAEFTGFNSTGGVVLSRNGARLAVYDDQAIKVYSNGPAWTLLRTINGNGHFVALSPDGSLMAFNTSGNLEIETTDTGTSSGLWVFPVTGVFAFRDNDTIADMQGGVVRFWDYNGSNWVQAPLTFQVGLNGPGYLYSIDVPSSFTRMAWSGDGTRLAAGDDSLINLYYDDQTTLTLPSFSFDQTGITHTANLLAVSGDGTVKVIGTSTDVQIFEKTTNWPSTATYTVSGAATSIDVSNDGTRVLVGTASKMFVLTNASGSWAQLGSDVIGAVANVAISGDGSKIFSDDGSAVKSFELSSGTWVTYLPDLTLLAGGRLIPTDDGNKIAVSKSTRSGIFLRYLITFPDSSNPVQVGSTVTGSKQTVSGDGNFKIVGDPTDNASTGSVKIFQKSSGTWSATPILTLTGSSAGDEFGRTVGISDDGGLAIVGSTVETVVFNVGTGQSSVTVPGNADIAQISGNGSLIYIYSQGVMKSYTTFFYSNPSTTHRPDVTQTMTGIKASLDGSMLAISDPGDCKVLIDTPVTQRYDFVPSGSTVTTVDEIAISGDASVRVIGDKTWSSSTGEVEIYEKDVNGNWLTSPTATFTGAATGEEFGRALGISENGSRIVIGSATKTMVVTNVSGSWAQLGSDIPGSVSLVAISGDGTKIFSEDTLDLRSYQLVSGNWTKYVESLEGALSDIHPLTRIVASNDGDSLALSKPDQNRIVTKTNVSTTAPDRFFCQHGPTITASKQAVSAETKVIATSTSVEIYQNPTLQGPYEPRLNQSNMSVFTWPSTAAHTISEIATSVDISADGSRVVVGTATKMLVVEYTSSWSQLGSDIIGATQAVAISKDGTKVMSSNGPGSKLKSYEYSLGSWVTYLPDLAVNATSNDTIIASTDGEIIAFTSQGQTSHQVYSREFLDLYQIDFVDSYSGMTEQAVSGNALVKVVGDPSYSSSTGRIEIYEKVGSAWPTIPDATFQGASVDARFGYSLAVSEDGTRIVVSSYATGAATPKVVVIEKSGGTWQQLGQDITGTKASKVAISGDGAYVFAYSPDEYLLKSYELSGGTTWVTYLGAITADSDFSKFSVSTNGDIVAVPQLWTDSRIYSKQALTNAFSIDQDYHYTTSSGEGKLSGNGAVFVYANTSQARIEIYEKTGGSWGTSPVYTSSFNIFDPRVDVSHDGLRVLAYDHIDMNGYTYVFEKASGVWSQLGGLIQGDGPIPAAAISGDGTKILRYSGSRNLVESYELSGGSWVTYLDDFYAIGVDDLRPSLDGDIVGLSIQNASRVFSKQPFALTPGYSFSLTNTISSSPSYEPQQVISGTGVVKIIGHPDDSSNGSYSGKVDIYRFSSGTWGLEQTIYGQSYDNLGRRLAISKDGSRAVLGGSGGSTRVVDYTAGGSPLWSQVGSYFNYSAYSLSISGDNTVVYTYDDYFLRSYEYTGGAWQTYAADLYEQSYAAKFVASYAGDFVLHAPEAQTTQVFKLSLSYNYNTNYRNDYYTVVETKISGDGLWEVQSDPNYYTGGGNYGRIRISEYDVNNNYWTQPSHVVSANNTNENNLGASVDISENGRVVFAGANLVRVIEKVAGSWVQVGSDIAVSGQVSFMKVGISGDGTKIYFFNGDSGSPLLKSYEYTGGSWVQYAPDIALPDITRISATTTGDVLALSKQGDNRVYEIQTSTAPPGFASPALPSLLGQNYSVQTMLRFGQSVDCSSDGNRVIIADAYHVRVFDLNSSTWSQVGSDISHAQTGDNSYRVSISGDGQYIAISNPNEYTNGGSVRFYYYDSYINDWSLTDQFTYHYNTNIYGGKSIAISADGMWAAVSLPHTNKSSYIGQVNIYQRSGSPFWSYHSTIYPMDAGLGYVTQTSFGECVAISEDGSRVVIGDHMISSYSGVVAVMEYNSSSGLWQLVGSVIYGQGTGNPRFGVRVSISSDGNQIVASTENSNYVKAYEYASGTWSALGNDIVGVSAIGRYDVRFSGDGNFLVIGSTDGSTNTDIFDMYEKVVSATAPGGYDWSLLKSTTESQSAWPQFDVAISRGTGTGNYNVFVSAPDVSYSGNSSVGKVDVHTYSTGGAVTTWSQRGVALPGENIDMTNDGTRVVGTAQVSGEGSYTWNSFNYVYDGQAGTSVPWMTSNTLEVSLSGDGTRAFTSGPNDYHRLWQWSGTEWLNSSYVVDATGREKISSNTDGSVVSSTRYGNERNIINITTTTQRDYNSSRGTFQTSAQDAHMTEDASRVVAVGTNQGSYAWNGVDYVFDGDPLTQPFEAPWAGVGVVYYGGNQGRWQRIVISRDGTRVIAVFQNNSTYDQEVHFFYKITHSGGVEWSDAGVSNPIVTSYHYKKDLSMDTDGDVFGFRQDQDMKVYDVIYTAGGFVDRYLSRSTATFAGRTMDMSDDGSIVVTTSGSDGYYAWNGSDYGGTPAPWVANADVDLPPHRVAISGDGTKVLACFESDSVRLYEKPSSTWTQAAQKILRIDASSVNVDHVCINTAGDALSIFAPTGGHTIYTVTSFTGDTYLTRSTLSTGRILDMDNAGDRIISLDGSFSWTGSYYASDSGSVPWYGHTYTDIALSGDGTRVIASESFDKIDFWYRSGSSWLTGVSDFSTSLSPTKISINTDGSFFGFVDNGAYFHDIEYVSYAYAPRGSAIQAIGAIDMTDDGAYVYTVNDRFSWSWTGSSGYWYQGTAPWSTTETESGVVYIERSNSAQVVVIVSNTSNVLKFRAWHKPSGSSESSWAEIATELPFKTLASGTLNDVSIAEPFGQDKFIIGVQHGSEVEFFDLFNYIPTASRVGYDTFPIESSPYTLPGPMIDMTTTNVGTLDHAVIAQHATFRYNGFGYASSGTAPWSSYDLFQISGDGLRVAAINSQGVIKFWYRDFLDYFNWSDLHVNTLSQGSSATELTMNTDGTIIGFWRTGALNEAVFYDIVFTPETPTYVVGYGSRGYETDNIIDMSSDGRTVVTESGMWKSEDADGNYSSVSISGSNWSGSTFDEVAVSGDGNRVVARSTADELHVWEYQTDSYVQTGIVPLTTADPKSDLSIDNTGALIGFATTGSVKFYSFSPVTVTRYEYVPADLPSLTYSSDYTFQWDVSSGEWKVSALPQFYVEIDFTTDGSYITGGPGSFPWANHTQIRTSRNLRKVYAVDSSGTLKRFTDHGYQNWTVNTLAGLLNPPSVSINTDGELLGIIHGGQARFYTFSSTQTPVGWSLHSSVTTDNNSFDMSNDGDTLAVGDTGVRVYDYASGWSLRSEIVPGFGTSVSISSDGNRIAAAGTAGVVVRDWDGSDWNDPVFRRNPQLPLGAFVEYVNIPLISDSVSSMMMSYDGSGFGIRTGSSGFAKRIAIGTVPGEVGWTNRRNSILTLSTGGSPTSLRSSSDGNIIAFGWVDSGTVRVRVYDLTSQLGSEISAAGGSFSVDLTNAGTRLAVLAGHVARVFEYSSGAWSQVGSPMYFVADEGSTIRISGGNGEYVALGMNAPADPKPFNVLRVYKYDLLAGQTDWRLVSPTMTVAKTPANLFGSSFALTDDGSRLIHGSVNDGAVEFSNFSGGGDAQFVQPSHEISGSRVVLDSANVAVISSSTDQTVRVYDVNNSLVTSFTTPQSFLKTPTGDQLIKSKPFSITSDGSKIVTVAPIGDVIVYENQGGGVWSQDGNTIPVTGDRVSSVDITNDGQRIIVGTVTETTFSSTTGKAQVFDLANGAWAQVGTDITTQGWEHRFANVVAISDTGRVVVSGQGAYNSGQPVGTLQSYELDTEVVDLTFKAPTIQLIGNSYVKIAHGDVYTELGATISTQASVVPELKISGEVQNRVAGTYFLRYDCEDLLRKKATAIFRQVDVMEELKALALIGERVVYHTKDTAYVDAGVEDIDATGYHVAPNSLVAVPGATFTPSVVGDWTVVWSDQKIDKHLRAGTTVTRTVRVRARPVLTLSGGSSIFHQLNDPYTDPGVSVDVGTVTATRPNVQETGVNVLTYTAVDEFGIEALPVTRTVNVKERPSIVAAQTSFYNIISDPISVQAPTVITPEGYASDLTPFLQSSNNININVRGEYTIAHTLVESDGISAIPLNQQFSVGSHGSLLRTVSGTVFALSRNGGDLAVFDTTLKTFRVSDFAQYGDVAVPAPVTSIKFTPDAQYMVVGMSSHLTIGLVRVYKKNIVFAGGWEQLGFDLFGTDYLGKFGESVDINSGATRIVVGAPEAGTVISKSGSVKIYDWTGFSWQQSSFVIEGTIPSQFLGFSVSLDNEGVTLAVGSPGHSRTTVSGTLVTTVNIGKVSVYKLVGSDWQLSGSEIEDGTEEKRNGTSVSLSRNGKTLAVGSVLGGGVRVYTLGVDWTGTHVPGSFGESVSLSSDGKTFVAGSKDEHKGRVYKYALGVGGWSRSTDTFDTIVAGEGSTTMLGKSVSLDGSGEVLCVSSNADVRIYGV